MFTKTFLECIWIKDILRSHWTLIIVYWVVLLTINGICNCHQFHKCTKYTPSAVTHYPFEKCIPTIFKTPYLPWKCFKKMVKMLKLYHVKMFHCALFPPPHFPKVYFCTHIKMLIFQWALINVNYTCIWIRSHSPRRKKRSPTPRPLKVTIGRLTRNVNKEHLQEIFSTYGTLKNIEMVTDRSHPHFTKGFAYLDFENPDDAEKAIKHMDGGKKH